MDSKSGREPDRDSAPRPPTGVDVRQQLAADRTLLAWIRTSIALAALGFVVARFDLVVRETTSARVTTWSGARILGVLLVVGSVLLGLIGLFQYRQVGDLLAAHGQKPAASKAPAIIGAVLILVMLVGLAVYLATGVK